MAVKVTLEILFPDLSREDLIALVVAEDDSHEHQEPPILPENVRGEHVVYIWAAGEFPAVNEQVHSSIEEVYN